ncbi:hypothetical protein [Bordetella sp. LUAb4]|uniref:hypothetical protein n=1 Tax=Bordetella sp. LUAb4 TaxID=2843195 RepID=UPI001E2CCC88|nr:hypothetical protein [Bordetella sp. LUAb4]
MRIGSAGPSAVQPQPQADRIDAKPGGVMRMLTIIRHGGESKALAHKESLRLKKEAAQITLGTAEHLFKQCHRSLASLRATRSDNLEQLADIEQRAMAGKDLDEKAGSFAEFIMVQEKGAEIAEALGRAEYTMNFASERLASTRDAFNKATTKYETFARKLGATE